MRVHVHIDELVLHGVTRGDHAGLAESLQSELTRLFTEHGVPSRLTHGGAVDRLNAGSIQTGSITRTQRTGEQIAKAVYGGLSAWATE